jgi:uncharacterized protein (DUF1800 family)
MTTHSKIPGCWVEAGKAALVATLCVVMAAPEAFAEAGVGVATPVQKAPLTRDQKTLHALNRLTFGPRPGDEAAVDKMGLEAWFQKQLHPESIDDSAFEARLDSMPALKLSAGEMMQRYPAPGEIKQMEKRGTPLPSDPVEHAIYADSEAFYTAAINAAGQPVGAAGQPVGKKNAAAAGAANDMAGGDMASGEDMSMAAKAPADPAMASDTAAAGKAKARENRRAEAVPMSQDELAALEALPPDQRMARFVAMSPEEMMGLRRVMRGQDAGLLAVGLSPQQKQDLAAMSGGLKVIAAEALEERILRDVYSQRQLQAVMDDFWLNHFSVYVRKNQNEPYMLASYERDAVLPHSLGKFEDLLVATAESPAMLTYLDNWLSIGPDSLAATRGKRFSQLAPNSKLAQVMPKGINENYARELMELHTLGVGGGYTQKDVIEVAKCFTGWTIDRPYNGGTGGFVFEENRHEPGSKTVLGHVIPEGGMQEGLTVLHILATSPATAHFVSKKLAERFVSDTPPAALVDRMAGTFLKSDGDIKAVLATMFHSPEYWSPAVYRAKVKTPIEFVASALRASDAQVGNAVALVQAMNQLGMPIYGMQTPNGYSWQADQWVSSNALVSRMNFALVLSGSKLPGARLNWPAVLGGGPDSGVAEAPTAKTETQLEALLLGQPAALHTRETVLANYNDPTAQQIAAKNFAASAAQAGEASDDDMAGAAKLLRAKNGGGGNYGGGQGFQANTPGTPLDTMAGLLLGSPDFQRR